MKKKKLALIFIVLATCFWFIPAIAQFDVTLSPILVEIDLVPGARKSFSVYLNNENAEKAVNLIAYTMDITENEQGAYKVVDKGQSEFSCADWMRIQDTTFTLEPGKSKEVKVQISVPPNVFGGRYAAVVFEVVPEVGPTGEKLGSVQYHFRMPAFVEASVKRFGGLVRKASISNFKVENVTSGPVLKEIGGEGLGFIAAVKNEGNIHLIGKGTLIIKDKEGKTKRRVPLGGGRGVVLPGTTVDYKSLLKKPPAGEYTARAVINFGGLSPSIAEIPFVVSRAKSSSVGSFKASTSLAMDIKPENVEFKTPPGGFRVATFNLRNDERDTISITAYVKDLEYDSEGAILVLDSSETGRSCRGWISLEPERFAVPPGRSNQVKFTLRVPSGSEGGYYACVVFDALLKGKKEESITTPFEIPVIMSVPPKLDLKGEVSDLEVSASAGKAAAFTAYFKNTGNIHIKPKGIISLQVFKEVKTTGDVTYVGKAQWEKVAQFPFEDVSQYVLPGGIRKMEAGYAGALGAGKYTAEISIDYGGSAPATFKKEFRIK